MSSVDSRDKFLHLNPGNLVRRKAIGIDLSDFEQLKMQLGESKQVQQAILRVKQQKDAVNRDKRDLTKAVAWVKKRDKLVTMTMLTNYKLTSNVSKAQFKDQAIRNLNRMAQPDGKTQTQREQSQEKERREEETRSFVRAIFNKRPCAY